MAYNYLSPLEDSQPLGETNYFKKCGWVVPNEEYIKTDDGNELIDENLNKSNFSL